MASVLAICISERRGIQKHPVPQAELQADYGIVGDAHAGDWHRQISLLAEERLHSISPAVLHGLLFRIMVHLLSKPSQEQVPQLLQSLHLQTRQELLSQEKSQFPQKRTCLLSLMK